MIDTSKIKAGDKVQIANGDWFKVFSSNPIELNELYVQGLFLDALIALRLITNHHPAEPTVPKGEGCINWGKNIYQLYDDGVIIKLEKHDKPLKRRAVAQGNVSNNYQQLLQERNRRAIKAELLKCDGAVYKPAANAGCYGDKQYWGILPVGIISHTKDIDSAIMEFACHFISEATARAALKKVGAERIRKAWGLE